jgi:cytochrome P450
MVDPDGHHRGSWGSADSSPVSPRAGLPPGPRRPGMLQTIEWALRPLALMESCRERHGDVFTLRVRGRPWVLLCDPEDVRRVFSTGAQALRAGAGEANPLLGPLLGPRSLILLDEPDHMTHRKIMLPAFNGERMREYGEIMDEAARREIADWPIGEPFALWPRMQAIGLEVVMRAVFGSSEGGHLRQLRVHLGRLTDWLNDSRRLALLSMLGSRRLTRDAGFREVIEPVEAALLAEVRRRRSSDGPHGQEGILAMLERAGEEHGSRLSEAQLRDELITLLSDGPTATSLTWAFERLLRDPDKLARLRREILADETDLYTDAVVKETLRLCPAVPLVMRELVEPLRLGGHLLPAGTIVAPCVYLIHRRADVYPQPASFLPERFLERRPGTYTWLPFGGGVRRCVAAGFAQLEMRRVLRAVLSEVELSAATAPGVTRARRSSVSFAPSTQGLVIATRRRSLSSTESRRARRRQTATAHAER